jgi:hypothetical protein
VVVVGSFRQSAELRKSPRKQVKYHAQIILGSDRPPQPCTLFDVSQSGARLIVESDDELPAYFSLLLTVNGRAGRHCRTVWRTGRELGVQFVRASDMPGYVEPAKKP